MIAKISHLKRYTALRSLSRPSNYLEASISQGSVATLLRCGEILSDHCFKFAAQFASERFFNRLIFNEVVSILRSRLTRL